MIRIATWNVNSLRIRGLMLARLMDAYSPDILCLQETKVEDVAFPHAMVEALGFTHYKYSGQKSYNGVAILSRLALGEAVVHDVLGNGEKRHLSVQIAEGVHTGVWLHCCYVPAGGDIPDPALNPKFSDKLAYMRWLAHWSATSIEQKMPHLLLGDLNIAPLEQDVWSHKQLLNVVSHTPVEVEHFIAAQQAAGWIDVARHFTPANEKLYSWWSYRNRDWQKSDRGRRLDHIWATPVLGAQLRACHTVREARGWEQGSDHVPVIVDIA